MIGICEERCIYLNDLTTFAAYSLALVSYGTVRCSTNVKTDGDWLFWDNVWFENLQISASIFTIIRNKQSSRSRLSSLCMGYHWDFRLKQLSLIHLNWMNCPYDAVATYRHSSVYIRRSPCPTLGGSRPANLYQQAARQCLRSTPQHILPTCRGNLHWFEPEQTCTVKPIEG